MFKKLNNMNVGKRLITSFIIVIVISSISGLVGAVSTKVLDYQYGKALVENGFAQGEVNRLTGYLQRTAARTRDVIFLTDQKEIDAAYADIQQTAKKTDEGLEAARAICTTPKEKELFAEFDRVLPLYRESRDKVLELGLANQNDEAIHLFLTECRPYLQQLIDIIDEVAAYNEELGYSKSQSLTTTSNIMLILIIVIIVISIAVGIKFAQYITKSFTKPLEVVKKASEKLSNCEFDIEINAKGNDEFAEMERYFQEAIDNIRHTIKTLILCLDTIGKGDLSQESPKTFKGEFIEVDNAMEQIIISLNKAMSESYEASKQVALGSVQLAEGAQALAEGATDQASSIQELTATIDTVSATIDTSAENALNSYNKTKQYEAEAENGNIEMHQLKEAMEQITSTSHEIASIAEQIEDIASQTNLLSLNASIEAARAGEAGRGFAVVAEQIGILATDSAKSAVTTKELITNALSEIEKGNAKMTTAAATFENIMNGMSDIASMSKENADSSYKQAEAMRQIKDATEQISSVIQSNAAVAEENSATSEEMAAQSETVQEIIQRFKLREAFR